MTEGLTLAHARASRSTRPSSRRDPVAVVAVAGALSWLSLFFMRLTRIAEGSWLARDDAVITLSHALNWAEFGSIGVSPGDRVEGYSSPLQLLVATAVFRVARIGYEGFLDMFVWSLIGAIGSLVALVAYFTLRSSGALPRRAAALAVVLAACVAVATLTTWTASGWLVSGMENPLVVAAGLAVAAFALSDSTQPRNTIGAAVALTMLGIARVEFAALVPPLIAAVAVAQTQTCEPARRRTVFLVTVGAPLLALVVTHVARRLYFGAWLPNTAVVQGRAAGLEQLVLLACLSAAFLAALVDTTILRALPRHPRVLAARAAMNVLLITCGGLAIWMTTTGRSKGSLAVLLRLPGLLLLVASLLALIRLVALFDRSRWTPSFVLAGLVFVPLSQYLVMGEARLEGYRVASIAIPFLATWVAVAAARLLTLGNPSVTDQTRAVRWAVLPVAMLMVVGLVWTQSSDRARYLPFGIGDSEELLDVAGVVQQTRLGGDAFPILSNPDLGKLSFTKKVIVVDLGLLGDPVLAQLRRHRNDLMVHYLNEVAVPDVVEAHGAWSCRYTAWLTSPTFQARWRLSDERWLNRRSHNPNCVLQGRYAVWIRADADHEYLLTRELASAERPHDVVATALAECKAAPGGPFRCQHVQRALQRTTVILRENGALGDVVAALQASPTATLDRALVSRGPNWGRVAFEEFVRLAG